MERVNSGTWRFSLRTYRYPRPINILWVGLKFFPVSSTWKTRWRYLFSGLVMRSWLYTALLPISGAISRMVHCIISSIYNGNHAKQSAVNRLTYKEMPGISMVSAVYLAKYRFGSQNLWFEKYFALTRNSRTHLHPNNDAPAASLCPNWWSRTHVPLLTLLLH